MAAKSPKKLTEKLVQSLKVPDGAASLWRADGEPDRNRGSLYLRVMPGGTKTWYFKYSLGERKRGTVKIGHAGKDGLSLEEARAKVEELRKKRKQDGPDLAATFKQEKLKRIAAAEAAELAAQEAKLAKEKTLEALLAVYHAYLQNRGSPGARDVKNIVKNHLPAALAKRSAAGVEPREIAKVTRGMVEKGLVRTAAKLRSFMAAAYNKALHAETDAHTPAAFLGFKVSGNPALATKSIAGNARDRALSVDELREVLNAIDALPDPQPKEPKRRGAVKPRLDPDLRVNSSKAALRLLLLLGGQRPVQLIRARVGDVDLDAGTIRLKDPKGRRKTPRIHLLPLEGDALALAAKLVKRSAKLLPPKDKASAADPYLFTATGTHQLSVEALSGVVHSICTGLVDGKKIKARFKLADLRRTCETQLAALGISKDTRAQLLSHGLSGVQALHYDKYSYMPEKRNALAAWAARLDAIRKNEPQPSNVVPMATAA